MNELVGYSLMGKEHTPPCCGYPTGAGMSKMKIVKYLAECDVQPGDGKHVFYTLYVVKKWWFIPYHEKINYGLQSEILNLCENLNKCLEITE